MRSVAGSDTYYKHGEGIPLRDLQTDAWAVSEDHGWHDEERTVGDRIALMHSELSEALEEFRNGRGVREVYSLTHDMDRPNKPEGVGVELADCVIRILDFCEQEGIPLEDLIVEKQRYNATRPYRHGGKRI